MDPELETISSETAALDEATAKSAGDTSTEGVLPVEPTPSEAELQADATTTRRELLRFLLSGHRPSGAQPIPAGHWPALLFDYRDLSRLRHDYPILQADDAHDGTPRPLSTIVDELIVEVGEGGDEEERLKRHLYRLESAIKSLAEQKTGKRLSELWDSATESLLSEKNLSATRKQRLQTNLMLARQALQTDGELLSCRPDVPSQFFTAATTSFWRDRCEGWREDMEALVSRLKDVLRADFDHSPAATSPQHLRESAGVADDMDFEAMSDILRDIQLGERLSEARRERITKALSIILEVQPLFGIAPSEEELFSTAPIVDDIDAAVHQYKRRMDAMTSFFKAVEIAQLEIENRYREESHDAYFAGFDESFLSDEQRSLCPPLTMHLSQKHLSDAKAGTVLKILASGLPIKLLVEVDDLCPRELDTQSVSAAWRSRLAVMAMALSDVYVLQCTVAHPLHLRPGFLEGLRYQGPALFNVYVGTKHSRLPAYFDAATATESRVFPTFRFDPGAGDKQADCMNILENPYPEIDWPAKTFRYSSAEDGEATTELVFMPADFLFCDTRIARHFWYAPPAMWHSDMLLLQEYLQLDAASTEAKIPYLTTVDADGQIGRVVMTRWVISSVLKMAQRWRNLQESGGINNSFALKLLAEEKQQLDDDKACEVAALEQEYSGKLDEDLGALTQEIAARIAAQLMSGAVEGVTTMPSLAPVAPMPAQAVPSAPAEQPPQEAPVEVEAVEEEEELSFDDPYIDTALCTSCNECTDMYPHIFNYDDNKQAYITDATAGPYRELVLAAEICPVRIIHPGKPNNPDEPNLEEWIKRAAPFN